MKPLFCLAGRLSIPLLTLLTLVVLSISPNLPTTQAEQSTNEQAAAAQTGPNLQFSMHCDGNDFVIELSGDGPFEIQGYGPGLPASPVGGPTLTLPGPANWLNVRLIELGGDLEFINLGDLICPALPNRPIELTTQCGSDDELLINITSLDTPGRMEGNYFGLPRGLPWPSLVTVPGPNVFTGIVIRELAGDFETYTVPEVSCGFGQYTLQASASCDGTTLQINIPVGDQPFHIVNSAGEYRTLYGVGTHLLTDYWPATGIIIRERSGDYEEIALGDIPCVAPTPTATPDIPTQTPEAPTEIPPLPVALPDYVPARVMQISAVQSQPVYDQPGGEPIRNPDHSLLLIPQDSDGNGWDTFVVLDAQIYEGDVWLGIYLGGTQLGWLPESSFGLPQD